MKSGNHEICQYLMILYVEVVVKNSVCFEHFVTYNAYKRKDLRRKNHIGEKDAVRFRVKITIEFEIDFEIFSICNTQHKLLHVNFL